jgi:hypothetical protein
LVRFDAAEANDVAQEDTRWYAKNTLSGIQLPLVYVEGFENLLEVRDKGVGGLGFNHDVVNICICVFLS